MQTTVAITALGLTLLVVAAPSLARPGPRGRTGVVQSLSQGLRLRRQIRRLELPSAIEQRALRVVGEAMRSSLTGGRVTRSDYHRVYIGNERGERIGAVRAARTADGRLVALRRPSSPRNGVELPTLILVDRDASGRRQLLKIELDSATSGYFQRKRAGGPLECSYAGFSARGVREAVKLGGRSQVESLKRAGPRNRGYLLQQLSLRQATDRRGGAMLGTWLGLGVGADQALRAAGALPPGID
jgi:hypothetical protein